MTGRRERRARATETRDQRRDTIRDLLARVDRTAAGRLTLTPKEAAALRAHVEAEIAHAEDLRASAAGAQAQAATLRNRATAADGAIRELEVDRLRMEQRAVDAEEQLRMYRVVEAQRQERGEQLLAALPERELHDAIRRMARIHPAWFRQAADVAHRLATVTPIHRLR